MSRVRRDELRLMPFRKTLDSPNRANRIGALSVRVSGSFEYMFVFPSYTED